MAARKLNGSYAAVRAEIAKLEREAEKLKASEVAGVIARIREAIGSYGLTPADLFGRGKKSTSASGPKPRPTKGRKVPIKYRDGDGNTWTGRGNRPRWLAASLASGKKLEDFLV